VDGRDDLRPPGCDNRRYQGLTVLEIEPLDRVEAYAKLATELERWRCLPFDDLVSLVGASPSVTSVSIGAEVIDVEVCIRWAEAKPGAILVEAVANGPSCWRLERLEEAVIVPAPQSSGRG
jgi:hypothetical protein